MQQILTILDSTYHDIASSLESEASPDRVVYLRAKPLLISLVNLKFELINLDQEKPLTEIIASLEGIKTKFGIFPNNSLAAEITAKLEACISKVKEINNPQAKVEILNVDDFIKYLLANKEKIAIEKSLDTDNSLLLIMDALMSLHPVFKNSNPEFLSKANSLIAIIQNTCFKLSEGSSFKNSCLDMIEPILSLWKLLNFPIEDVLGISANFENLLDKFKSNLEIYRDQEVCIPQKKSNKPLYLTNARWRMPDTNMGFWPDITQKQASSKVELSTLNEQAPTISSVALEEKKDNTSDEIDDYLPDNTDVFDIDKNFKGME